MTDVTCLAITKFTSGGVEDGGHRVYLNVQLQNGREVTLILPAELGERCAHEMEHLVGRAHKERLAKDPTYTRPGQLQYRQIKPVDQWEFAFDFMKNAVVLAGRHADGTITSLPIPLPDVARITTSLSSAAERARSLKPKRDS